MIDIRYPLSKNKRFDSRCGTSPLLYPQDADYDEPISLKEMCDLGKISPEMENQFFDSPKGTSKRRSFAELTTLLFDSESDPHDLNSVLDLVLHQPHLSSKFHTVGWVAGCRGYTLNDLFQAGWRMCPSELDFQFTR
ncbi:hypothetical protein [uncultured Gimesia sp.]|uniref:hypothetical protein n=1 Tax=uncultured Gimesia sp. TaxID=1678688 RepID=UPI002602948A|nr:hypothetical protein [uncultured Gimesia sp.]